MILPSQTYSTIQQLLNDINARFIPNGAEAITGDIGNSQLNGLANFIVKYAVNAQLAGISSSTGVVALSKPITIFSVTPTSLNWSDNVQFEYYIVNATSSIIPLTGGTTYVDNTQVVRTSVPANATVHLAKTTNGSWVQVNNLSNNLVSNTSIILTQFIIGQGGSPMTAGQTVLVLTYPLIINNSVLISKDGTVLPVGLNDRISYTVVYTSTNLTITFNTAVATGELYIISLWQFV